MKKNLRIVSAAAAALLAVAPVAATSVSTVFADTTNVNVDGGAGSTTADSARFDLTVNNAFKLNNGDSASKLSVSLSKNALPAGANFSYGNVKVYKADNVTVDGNNIATVKKDSDSKEFSAEQYLNSDSDTFKNGYVAVISITITGLKAGQKYTINGDEFTATASNSIADVKIASPVFHIATQGALGTPYLKDKQGVAVSTGYVPLDPSKYSVQGVYDAIKATYDLAVTASSGATNVAKPDWVNLKQDIRDGLKAAGITTDTNADETFGKPAAAFPVSVRLIANNGQTNTVVVNVDPNSDKADETFPVISYHVKGDTTAQAKQVPTSDKLANVIVDAADLVGADNKAYNFNYVPVNGVVDTEAIKKAFTATVAAGNADTLGISVDASKVNTKVAGRYPVVVSATNAAKKTSKVTVILTVGVKGATYKTVQSDGDVPVYKIDGNNVTDTKTTVKNGDQIAVFGDAIKVGDKSYTRINSADSDLYVETKYVDGSFKPADKTSKTVMHNAYIYDKDHKRVGTKTLAAYTKVDVLGATTKLADGSLVYQIGDNQYVMADNIDGTVRTLSHNAYVYKTSKKRADSRVLRKGAKVTTYGSPYTFKNGKAYYRIGGPSKQYVKVANFN